MLGFGRKTVGHPAPTPDPGKPYVRGIDKCYKCDALLERYAQAKADHLAALASGTRADKERAEKARLALRQEMFHHKLVACLRDTFPEE